MDITIVINTCNDCRHLHHSGSFSPGGELPVCSHNKAVYGCHARVVGCETARDVLVRKGMSFESAAKYKFEEGEEAMILLEKHRHGKWALHWIHRVPYTLETWMTIPSWCPLKDGAKY